MFRRPRAPQLGIEAALNAHLAPRLVVANGVAPERCIEVHTQVSADVADQVHRHVVPRVITPRIFDDLDAGEFLGMGFDFPASLG